MRIDLSYKECCILMHALRDKVRDRDEDQLYVKLGRVVNEVQSVDNKTAIVHSPIPSSSRNRILK